MCFYPGCNTLRKCTSQFANERREKRQEKRPSSLPTSQILLQHRIKLDLFDRLEEWVNFPGLPTSFSLLVRVDLLTCLSWQPQHSVWGYADWTSVYSSSFLAAGSSSSSTSGSSSASSRSSRSFSSAPPSFPPLSRNFLKPSNVLSPL